MTLVKLKVFMDKPLSLLAVFLLLTMCAKTSITFGKPIFLYTNSVLIFDIFVSNYRVYFNYSVVDTKPGWLKIEPRRGHLCPAGVTTKYGR